MRILITGANGFLGSHLVKYFFEKKSDIYAISLNTYRLTNIIDQIQYSSCPINSITTLEKRICNFKPDIVLHTAWHGGNSYSSINMSSQFKQNLPGLSDLLEIIDRYNISNFICIGSAAEYGNCIGYIKEKTRENPTNLYGTCKLMAKQYSEQFCKNKKINWTWIRPFYVFGPDDVPSRVIPSVITKCLKKEEVHLNDCKMHVDYLYIDDFVNAVNEIIEKRKTGVFNICSGLSIKVRNIIDDIAIKTQNKSNIRYGIIPNRTDMPNSIVGSRDKISSTVKWIPQINIYEGITKTIEYYKKI